MFTSIKAPKIVRVYNTLNAKFFTMERYTAKLPNLLK